MSTEHNDEGRIPGALVYEVPEAREGLRRDLTHSEDKLLRIVFGPFYGENGQWPTWDYVSRRMYQVTHLDAWSIWLGLPTVRILNAYGQLIQYGLLWRTNENTVDPWPDSRIGLTIPGLLAISSQSMAARELIDWAIEVGRQCAQYEIDAPLDPGKSDTTCIKTGIWDESLANFTGLPRGIRPLHAWEMFKHEPLMPAVRVLQSTSDGEEVAWELRVLPRDRQLVIVASADQYLDLVEAEAHHHEPGPQPAAPVDLIRAFDFFAMAVALAPYLKWSNVLSPRRLLPITRLVQLVDTPEEFSDRLSALANILGDLNVPSIPPGDWNKSQPPKSLDRLEYWLVTKHGLPIEDGVKVLRAVNRVRVHFQHPSADRDARRHYQLLKLEMPITNWSQTWNTVIAHATHALQSIADTILDYDSDGVDSKSE